MGAISREVSHQQHKHKKAPSTGAQLLWTEQALKVYRRNRYPQRDHCIIKIKPILLECGTPRERHYGRNEYEQALAPHLEDTPSL